MNLFLDDVRLPKQAYPYMKTRIGDEAELYLDLDWEVVTNFR